MALREFAKKKRGIYKPGQFQKLNATIPRLVDETINYLEENNCVNVEGLFRLAGSNDLVLEMKRSYDQGIPVHLSAVENPHNIACLLKLYLRELPQPLFTFEFYDCFIAADSIKDEESRFQCLKTVLNLLPIGNRLIAQKLLGYLSKVAKNSPVNKMSSTNIAIVFAPTLLRPQGDNQQSLMLSLSESDNAVRIVESIILRQDEIFEESMSKSQGIACQGREASTQAYPRDDEMRSKVEIGAFYTTLKHSTIRMAKTLVEESEHRSEGEINSLEYLEANSAPTPMKARAATSPANPTVLLDNIKPLKTAKKTRAKIHRQASPKRHPPPASTGFHESSSTEGLSVEETSHAGVRVSPQKLYRTRSDFDVSCPDHQDNLNPSQPIATRPKKLKHPPPVPDRSGRGALSIEDEAPGQIPLAPMTRRQSAPTASREYQGPEKSAQQRVNSGPPLRRTCGVEGAALIASTSNSQPSTRAPPSRSRNRQFYSFVDNGASNVDEVLSCLFSGDNQGLEEVISQLSDDVFGWEQRQRNNSKSALLSLLERVESNLDDLK